MLTFLLILKLIGILSAKNLLSRLGLLGIHILLKLNRTIHYAIRPVFSDGHDSGLYSWDYLYRLGREQGALWQRYLQQIEERGLSRRGGETPPVARKSGGCGGGGCGCAG